MKPTSWSKVVKASAPGTDVERYDLPAVADAPAFIGESGSPTVGDGLSAVERQAYERGFATGERAGREVGYQELEAAVQVVKGLITELSTRLDALDEEVLAVAFAVAKRVALDELSTRQETVLAYAREAIAKLGSAETVVIRVHPRDVERLGHERANLLTLIEGLRWLRVEADGSLAPGECVVEGGGRTVDARVGSQIAVLERDIRRAV